MSLARLPALESAARYARPRARASASGTRAVADLTVLRSEDCDPATRWVRLSVGAVVEQTEQLLQQFSTEVPLSVIDRDGDILPENTKPADDWVSSGFNFRGTIYLVREGLPDGAAVTRTLWHKTLHFGLRRFFASLVTRSAGS